ncbi:MAG: hypothetical protein ACRC01_01655, partial [Deefgea sp.]
ALSSGVVVISVIHLWVCKAFQLSGLYGWIQRHFVHLFLCFAKYPQRSTLQWNHRQFSYRI